MSVRKATGAVTMSAVLLIGFYVLILENTNTLRGPQNKTALPTQLQETDEVTNQQTVTPQNPQPGTTAAKPPVIQTVSKKYNDGSFKMKADYMAPSGVDQFNVEIEIKNDTVTRVKTDQVPSSDMSRYFQEELFAPFISGIVAGKKVDEAQLRYIVNGASLHSVAFYNAFEEIKKEALRTGHNLTSQGS